MRGAGRAELKHFLGSGGGVRDDAQKIYSSTQPGGRSAEPVEIANAIASDEASFVSGETLLVNAAQAQELLGSRFGHHDAAAEALNYGEEDAVLQSKLHE